MDHAFGVLSKKNHCQTQDHLVSSMLSSRSFKVLHFTFRSMTHFELIFVKGVRSVSRLSFLFLCLFLTRECTVATAPLVEKTIHFPFYCISALVKDQLTIFV